MLYSFFTSLHTKTKFHSVANQTGHNTLSARLPSKLGLLALLGASLFFQAPLVVSANLSALDIIQRSEKASYYAGQDGSSEARMTIVDGQDRRQIRQFNILRKNVAGSQDQRFILFFSRPVDVKDMVFRVEKHTGANQVDDRWLYLPSMDLLRRISAGDKRTSFVGSHFFYEDVSGRAISEDNFERLSDEGGLYRVKAIPKDPNSVEFNYYIAHIHPEHFLPIKVEFFKSGNKLYRLVESVDIQTILGNPTVMTSKISDIESNGHTLLQFRNVRYDIGLPDDLFDERSMRNIPTKWLK